MDNVIKQIMKIINPKEDSSTLKIIIYGDREICFEIYENEIGITIDKKTKQVYVDTEINSHRLCADMLLELASICKLLENNIETIVECLEVD